MSKELNKIMGMVCERERMYYNAAKVDAVIAEKDAEIADLIEKNKRLANKDIIMASESIKDLFKELRHSNRKRCLAMARWCHNQREIYERDSYNWELEDDAVNSLRNKASIMRKWRKRWLALAEEPTWAKFLQLIHKEAK